MEVALRRRLDGVVDVSISQARQTAAVTFAPGTRTFTTAEFRAALQEAGVTVLSLQIDVCGYKQEGGLWLTDERESPFALIRGAAHADGALCISGRLDDRVTPYHLTVTTRGR